MPPIDREIQAIRNLLRGITSRSEVPMGRDITAGPSRMLQGRLPPAGLLQAPASEMGPTALIPSRPGPYGPAKLAARARRGATTLDDVRDALLRIDPSLAGGVRGRGAGGDLPPSRSLVRLPPPPTPPGGGLSPVAAGSLGLAAGLSGNLSGDTPERGIQSQSVPNAPLYNTAGIPSRLEGPVTRPVPNAPLYNTAGIPPNLASPRAEPRAMPPSVVPPSHRPLPDNVPMPAPRPAGPIPSVPLPRSRARVAAGIPNHEEENRSLLEMLFGGAVDKYGRKYEAPYQGY